MGRIKSVVAGKCLVFYSIFLRPRQKCFPRKPLSILLCIFGPGQKCSPRKQFNILLRIFSTGASVQLQENIYFFTTYLWAGQKCFRRKPFDMLSSIFRERFKGAGAGNRLIFYSVFFWTSVKGAFEGNRLIFYSVFLESG